MSTKAHKNEILSSDDDSVHNSDNETNDVTNDVTMLKQNTKKTFEQSVTEYKEEASDLLDKINNGNINDLLSNLKKFTKLHNNFVDKLPKLHLKSGSKKPRKQTEHTGKSGFNKPTKIPKQFSTYLELDAETEMTRPQLVKELNKKFTESGFKTDGVICISDKKIAKVLEVDKNYKFSAKDFHIFIKKYYLDKLLVQA